MSLPFAPFAATLTLAALFATAPAAWADETFKARLSSDQEVATPPVESDTTGKFKIQFNKTETEAEMTLAVSDGQRIRQAHLHCGGVGVNGPIVVFIAGDNAAGYDVDGKWVSNAIVTDSSIVNPACGATLAALVAQIRAGNVYVNVHSVSNPGGVIRGQLEPAEEE
jgi:CHRD domain-containing protein